MSLRNHFRYHMLILAKKNITPTVSLSSANSLHRWQTVKKLIHRKSASPLPTSTSPISLAYRFASFFTDNISKLLFSLSAHPTIAFPYCPSPLVWISPPDFSTFRPVSESEVSKILFSVPTSNPTLILSPPGYWKNSLQFSLLQSPISSFSSGKFRPIEMKELLKCKHLTHDQKLVRIFLHFNRAYSLKK